jgi:2-polyprenyl-6-methoxyphenol hydroxylase-like FAD-dependent oxidoreductase
MALRTVIVGGGIGGLSLARELTQRGLNATVLERTAKPATVGAGIIMNPNAMAVLERNGLASSVRAQSCRYVGRDTHDHRGRRLATHDYRPLYATGRLVEGALVHRGHLHQCLHDGLPAGVVHHGVTMREMTTGSGGVRVQTDGGETITGDVLVGADGIRSQVRARFFGPTEPVYLGYRSHRFVVENRDGLTRFTEFLGRGQSLGLVPIGGGHLYVWTTFGSPLTSRDWGLDSGDAFRRRFGHFTDPRVSHALEQIASTESIICTEIEEVRQEPWVAGRVVLLGDSAHAITPGMGQGAGMAMEGAAVLAEELALADRGRKPLTAALADYVARRRARVETIRALSRAVIERGQLTNPFACWLRNQRVRREGRSVVEVESALVRLLAWSPDKPREEGES